MKNHLFYAFFLVPAVLYASSAELPSHEAKTLATALYQNWQNVRNLEGTMQTTGVSGFSEDKEAGPATIQLEIDPIKKIPVARLPEKILAPVTTASWKLCDDGSFFMKWAQSYPQNTRIDRQVTPILEITTTWDREVFNEMRSSNGDGAILSIKSSLPARINAFVSEDFLAMPFRFMIPTSYETAMSQFPSLEFLKNPTSYEQLLQSCKYMGKEDVLGAKCEVFELDGGVGIWDNKPVKYKIYLNVSEDLFPIGWDEISSRDSVLRREYRVNEIGKLPLDGGIFRYSKNASLTYFKPAKGGEKPEVNVAYQTVVDFIKLNGTEAFDYTLDPASASIIYDLDKKQAITVPR